MNTYQLNYVRRAYAWWDKLTLGQKAFYGKNYSYHNANELILKAYEEYLKNNKHLKLIK